MLVSPDGTYLLMVHVGICSSIGIYSNKIGSLVASLQIHFREIWAELLNIVDNHEISSFDLRNPEI